MKLLEVLDNIHFKLIAGDLNKEITSVKIAEEVVDPEDIEMLEDLVMAAVNEAIRMQSDDEKEQLGKITGGLGGGLGGLF